VAVNTASEVFTRTGMRFIGSLPFPVPAVRWNDRLCDALCLPQPHTPDMCCLWGSCGRGRCLT
jgi:hypothetical protein